MNDQTSQTLDAATSALEAGPADPRGGDSALGRVYARALIELADQHGKLDEVAEQVRDLGRVVHKDPKLQELLQTPAISPRQRAESLDRMFRGRLDDTLYKFLQVLNTKGRLDSLSEIFAAFDRLLAERRGIVEADIFVVDRLPEDQAQRVAAALGEGLGGKRVVLHQSTDPELIGGIKIRVGDQLIDGSVAAQLRLIRRRLTAAGRDHEMEALQDDSAPGESDA